MKPFSLSTVVLILSSLSLSASAGVSFSQSLGVSRSGSVFGIPRGGGLFGGKDESKKYVLNLILSDMKWRTHN